MAMKVFGAKLSSQTINADLCNEADEGFQTIFV